MPGNPEGDRSREEEPEPLFPLGMVVATKGALTDLAEANVASQDYLHRHVTGDWGDVAEEDAQENELSLKNGFRLMSVYHTSKGVKIWIITERDRSVTTILFPEEY